MFGMRMNALFRALLVTAGLLVVAAGAGYAAEGDAPENAVDINDDLALVVDGEPFFPYGFCGVTEPELKEIAAMGCNTAWTFRARAVPPLRPFKDIKDVEQQLAYMDAAEEAGLKVIAYWENFNKRDRFISHGYHTAAHAKKDPQRYGHYAHRTVPYMNKLFEDHLQSFKEALPRIKEHPALLAYSSLDEPGRTAELRELDRPLCKKVYDAVQAEDPYHPVMMLFGHWVKWTDNDDYDVVAIDAYWKVDLDRDSAFIIDRFGKLFDTAEEIGKPGIAVLYYGIEKLPPQAQRCQTYLTLILGAKGILYFTYDFKNPESEMPQMIRQLASEIKVLGPIMLTPEVEPIVAAPDAKDIHMTERVHEGKRYLICANASTEPVQVQFQARGDAEIARMTELFEERALAEGLTDTFEGHGSHVYIVE